MSQFFQVNNHKNYVVVIFTERTAWDEFFKEIAHVNRDQLDQVTWVRKMNKGWLHSRDGYAVVYRLEVNSKREAYVGYGFVVGQATTYQNQFGFKPQAIEMWGA